MRRNGSSGSCGAYPNFRLVRKDPDAVRFNKELGSTCLQLCNVSFSLDAATEPCIVKLQLTYFDEEGVIGWRKAGVGVGSPWVREEVPTGFYVVVHKNSGAGTLKEAISDKDIFDGGTLIAASLPTRNDRPPATARSVLDWVHGDKIDKRPVKLSGTQAFKGGMYSDDFKTECVYNLWRAGDKAHTTFMYLGTETSRVAAAPGDTGIRRLSLFSASLREQLDLLGDRSLQQKTLVGVVILAAVVHRMRQLCLNPVMAARALVIEAVNVRRRWQGGEFPGAMRSPTTRDVLTASR